jgi:hypothetical protein
MKGEVRMSEPRMRAWLNARKVGEVRSLADGAPYRWERRKAELIEWLIQYQPGKVQAARDDYLTPEASRARANAVAKADAERGWCQGTTNTQLFGGSWASSSWGCERRPSRKPGDDPGYCWQHQPARG